MARLRKQEQEAGAVPGSTAVQEAPASPSRVVSKSGQLPWEGLLVSECQPFTSRK